MRAQEYNLPLFWQLTAQWNRLESRPEFFIFFILVDTVTFYSLKKSVKLQVADGHDPYEIGLTINPLPHPLEYVNSSNARYAISFLCVTKAFSRRIIC